MMLLLLLLLTTFVHPVHSCTPTSSITVPAPILPTCSVGCDPFIFMNDYNLVTVASTNAMGCDVLTLTCEAGPPYTGAEITYNSVNMVNDGGTGTVQMVVTCNPAGTTFAYMGTDVTQIMCNLS